MDALVELNTALAGRYTLERILGRGGMATVYLAVDVKHDRRVALKVLEPELGAVLGPDRFLAEIRTTANLQHPHLLPLFDSGAAAGLLFYVMPFVDGESLRARLEREKQLPVDEAVRIATSVAGALEYAHARGVIHRDLKPENILLQAGQPVVADFGIALAVSKAGGARVTQTGLSLGTPQYMSPEQATGDRAIDGRTDLYSLGAVLYEMLTGDPPHTASTAQAIIAKVLTERPPSVRSTRPAVPEYVADAIECALEKLPADRFATAQEFANALHRRSGVMAARTRTVHASPRSAGRWVAVSTAVSVAAVAVAAWSWSHRNARVAATDDLPILSTILPPQGEQFGAGSRGFSVSPDGRSIAVVVRGADGARALFVRSLATLAATPLTGTRDATLPFWSPDGASVGFFADAQLKTIHIQSGTIRSLCPAAFPTGGSWGTSDVILFSGDDGPLRRVSPTGGPCTELAPNGRALSANRPAFLPDGKHFIAWARGTSWLGSLDDTTLAPLRESPASFGVFAPPNFLLFREWNVGNHGNGEGSLYAQRIDVGARKLVGEPRRILDRVINPSGFLAASASTNGVLLAQGPGVTTNRVLLWVSRGGGPGSDSIGVPQDVWTLRRSHDGQRLTLGGWDLVVVDVARQVSTTAAAQTDTGLQVLDEGAWAPHDTLIAYSRDYDRYGVGLFDPRTGRARDLFSSPNPARGTTVTDWSPDGRYLAFSLSRGGGVPRDEAWIYDFVSHAPRQLFETPGSASELRFSPDGHWVAYQDADANGSDVYIRPFPGPGIPVRVSSGGGHLPRWRGDGRELFYATPNGAIMAVEVRAGASISVSSPRPAIPFAPLGQPNYDGFEPSVDGQRFAFLLVTGESPALMLVQNWWALMGPSR
jgi:Tol biopolymer transport system component/tRNA A-37 threonylcarbamoyl transferase component Bud32